MISYVSCRTSFGTLKFGDVVAALDHLPDETVIDGEVALDREDKPSFNLLQTFRSMESLIVFYAFNVLVHKGKDLTGLPFVERINLASRFDGLPVGLGWRVALFVLLAAFEPFNSRIGCSGRTSYDRSTMVS